MLKPTYIGLREYLNIPEVTNDEAVSGFKGFTVVAAARNEMPPEMAKPMPSINNTMVVTRVCWSLSIAAVGVAVEIAQISRAKSKPMMGGGILVSSVFMGLILAFHLLLQKIGGIDQSQSKRSVILNGVKDLEIFHCT